MSYLFKYYFRQYDSFMRLFKLDKNEEIIKSLANIESKKIVDIGGGTGTLAQMLMELKANVTIVDPEKNMTRLAKEKNNEINILNEYSNNISLKSKSIDIIIMRDAFHHIMDKKETLKECKRLLKEDGVILICEFDKEYFKSRLIAVFEKCCFEKIEMVTRVELRELGKVYFKDERLIDITDYEFIYVAKNK